MWSGDSFTWWRSGKTKTMCAFAALKVTEKHLCQCWLTKLSSQCSHSTACYTVQSPPSPAWYTAQLTHNHLCLCMCVCVYVWYWGFSPEPPQAFFIFYFGLPKLPRLGSQACAIVPNALCLLMSALCAFFRAERGSYCFLKIPGIVTSWDAVRQRGKPVPVPLVWTFLPSLSSWVPHGLGLPLGGFIVLIQANVAENLMSSAAATLSQNSSH